jgi:hypothetical protein
MLESIAPEVTRLAWACSYWFAVLIGSVSLEIREANDRAAALIARTEELLRKVDVHEEGDLWESDL